MHTFIAVKAIVILVKMSFSFDHSDSQEYEHFLIVFSSLLHSYAFVCLAHDNIGSFLNDIVSI